MGETVKALVVDDHPLVANATKELLEQTGEITVIGVVGTGKQCMEQVQLHLPELVLLDYQLPDMTGTEITKQIKSRYPRTRVIIFTGVDYLEFFDQLVEAGVSGILSKESSMRTIRNMINCILDNHTMLPLSVYQDLKLQTHAGSAFTELDQEEIQIMNMLISGSTYEQIANAIHMSKRTVDNYMKRIFDKMGVKTRLEAIEAFLVNKKYANNRRG